MCNATVHFQDALSILPLIGVQGRASPFFDVESSIDPESVGLLLLRTYAVTDHKRSVLVVLGILGVCTIVLDLVCAHVHFYDWCDRHLSKAGAILNSCDLTSVQLRTFIM